MQPFFCPLFSRPARPTPEARLAEPRRSGDRCVLVLHPYFFCGRTGRLLCFPFTCHVPRTYHEGSGVVRADS